jgi:Tfp pilus assembly protein PilX
MRSQSKTWHAAIHNACHHTRTPPMFQQANMENWQNAEETLRSQIAAVKKNHQYNKKNQQEHWQQHHKTV